MSNITLEQAIQARKAALAKASYYQKLLDTSPTREVFAARWKASEDYNEAARVCRKMRKAIREAMM